MTERSEWIEEQEQGNRRAISTSANSAGSCLPLRGRHSMDTVKVMQVIETTLLRRGSGDSTADPIRIITQYWTMDGKLLVEIDPFPFTKEPTP